MNTALPIAFSPCPNDTFLFHAWIAAQLGDSPTVIPTLADVQQLNAWALQGKYPLSKVSIQCVGQILEDYVLLPTGCALGEGCGPKIVAREPFDLAALAFKRIAVPGVGTTAHLLLNLLVDDPAEKVFCTYDEVLSLIRDEVVDCGLIIHETRFSFEQQGFVEIADLGHIWKALYCLPLPLGGIVAKRALGNEMLRTLVGALQASLKKAWQEPQASLKYILEHSIEKNLETIHNHIHLYVNEETAKLSERGRAAIAKLLELGRAKNLLPPSRREWLFEG